MTKARSQIIKNLIWGNMNIVIRYATAFIVVVLLARFYPPAEFGQYQLAITYITIFEAMSLFHGQYVRNVLIAHPEKESLFVSVWILQWLGVWGLAVVFSLVNIWISGDFHFWALFVLMCVKLLFKPFEVVAVLADIRLRNDLVQRTQIVTIGTFNLSRALVAISGLGMVWIYACSVVQGVGTAIYQMILKRSLGLGFRFQFGWSEAWDLVRGGALLALTGFLGVFQLRIAAVLLEGRMLEATYGNYQLLLKLIEPAVSLGLVAMGANYTVMAHTDQKHPDIFLKRFLKVSALTVGISIVTSSIFLVVPEGYLYQILGAHYGEAFAHLKMGPLLLLANTILAIGATFDLLRRKYSLVIAQYAGSFLISIFVFVNWTGRIEISEALVVSAIAASLPVACRIVGMMMWSTGRRRI